MLQKKYALKSPCIYSPHVTSHDYKFISHCTCHEAQICIGITLYKSQIFCIRRLQFDVTLYISHRAEIYVKIILYKSHYIIIIQFHSVYVIKRKNMLESPCIWRTAYICFNYTLYIKFITQTLVACCIRLCHITQICLNYALYILHHTNVPCMYVI